MGQLAGKVAIVTGSTSGIGLGIAEALAEAGAKVMLNGLGDAGEIEKTRSGLAERYGVEVAYSDANLMDPDAVAEMVAETERTLGPVDILVNNAGIQFVSPVEEFPREKWDAIIALNLSAVFHGTKAVLPGMKARRWGRIVNIASAHGLVASPFKSAYVAAKHGVLGMTKVVALENGEYGVTANAICPGYVQTPLVEKQIDEQAKAHGIPREDVVKKIMLEPQPTKEFVGIDELGAFTVFLCTDQARSITGAALPADGGWTAR